MIVFGGPMGVVRSVGGEEGEDVAIEDTLRRHEDALMDLPNVQGVGVGERAGRKVIKVLVTTKVPRSSLRTDEVIPEALEGYEVVVEPVGTITARPAEPNKED